MARLHFLGTGAALSDPERTTTMLAVSSPASFILIDCGGDVWQRVLSAGLKPAAFGGIIITHEHPDHVSGFPLFMEKLWLAGRRERVPVYGIAPALAQARRSHDAFDTSSWRAEGYPEIRWHEVALQQGATVVDDEAWHISAAPGRHAVPAIGLRIHAKGGGVAVYSGDTEPCDGIADLARGADVLVHEATGPFPGHSSAVQAAEIAAQAGVGRLRLVHLPPAEHLGETEMNEARARFADTEKAEEGAWLEF